MKPIVQTISTNMSGFSHPKLVDYITTLLDGVTNNEDFPTLQGEVKTNKDLFGEYSTAVANAPKGGQAVKLLRNGLRPQVEAAVRAWSEEALIAKPNNPVAWAGAHFMLTKGTRQSRPSMQGPNKVKLSDGKLKGSVCANQNAQKFTRAYVYEYALQVAEGQELVWKYCLYPKNMVEITGLTSGQSYWFRMGAWNGTGETIFSAPELRVVQ